MDAFFYIYKPYIAIHGYGVCIAVGVFIALQFALRHPLRIQWVNSNQFINIVSWALIWGIIGGRLIYGIGEWSTHAPGFVWQDIFKIWQGGLSVLGAILAILVTLPLYLWYYKIPIVPVLDIFGLFAPLVEVFARLGCFVAGCCYGKPTTGWWAVSYKHSSAPELYGKMLHPTPLYTAAIMLLIFILFQKILYKKLTKQGQYITLYLFFAGITRWGMDFFRGDQVIIVGSIFTFYQWISLIIACCGLILFFIISSCSKKL